MESQEVGATLVGLVVVGAVVLVSLALWFLMPRAPLNFAPPLLQPWRRPA